MNVLQHTRNELNLCLKQNRPDRSYRDTLLILVVVVVVVVVVLFLCLCACVREFTCRCFVKFSSSGVMSFYLTQYFKA